MKKIILGTLISIFPILGAHADDFQLDFIAVKRHACVIREQYKGMDQFDQKKLFALKILNSYKRGLLGMYEGVEERKDASILYTPVGYEYEPPQRYYYQRQSIMGHVLESAKARRLCKLEATKKAGECVISGSYLKSDKYWKYPVGWNSPKLQFLTREIEVVQSDYIDRVQYIQNEEELDRYLWTVFKAIVVEREYLAQGQFDKALANKRIKDLGEAQVLVGVSFFAQVSPPVFLATFFGGLFNAASVFGGAEEKMRALYPNCFAEKI